MISNCTCYNLSTLEPDGLQTQDQQRPYSTNHSQKTKKHQKSLDTFWEDIITKITITRCFLPGLLPTCACSKATVSSLVNGPQEDFPNGYKGEQWSMGFTQTLVMSVGVLFDFKGDEDNPPPIQKLSGHNSRH